MVTIVLHLPEAVCTAHGDHVRRLVWEGSVKQATFSLEVLASAAPGRYPCRASVVCGTQALCMEFAIAVSHLRDVRSAAAVAAASAARQGGCM